MKLDLRRILMAGGTFGAAIGIGFVMQNGDALAARFGGAPVVTAPPVAPAPAVERAPLEAVGAQENKDITIKVATAGFGVVTATAPAAPVAPMPAVLAAPEDLGQPSAPPADPVVRAAFDPAPVAPAPDHHPMEVLTGKAAPAEEDAPLPAPEVAQDCTVRMEAAPAPAASVVLTLSAPCNGNERLSLHHEGMRFTEVTDADGALEITVPALNESAVFIAAFDSGVGTVTTTNVSALSLYDRVVLQWQGEGAMQIHAREFGADYGDPGHIWAEARMDAGRAARGQGGFLMRLGNAATAAPRMAEVYTFPSGSVQSPGTVRLSVEAEVTAANCGREIEAETLQIGQGGASDIQELTLSLALPGCDAVGDFLVLQNLLTDLTIAQN